MMVLVPALGHSQLHSWPLIHHGYRQRVQFLLALLRQKERTLMRGDTIWCGGNGIRLFDIGIRVTRFRCLGRVSRSFLGLIKQACHHQMDVVEMCDMWIPRWGVERWNCSVGLGNSFRKVMSITKLNDNRFRKRKKFEVNYDVCVIEIRERTI